MVAHCDLDLNRDFRGCKPIGFTSEVPCYPAYIYVYTGGDIWLKDNIRK